VSQYSLKPLQKATSSVKIRLFSVPLPFSDVTTLSQPFNAILEVPPFIFFSVISNSVSFFFI